MNLFNYYRIPLKTFVLYYKSLNNSLYVPSRMKNIIKKTFKTYKCYVCNCRDNY